MKIPNADRLLFSACFSLVFFAGCQQVIVFGQRVFVHYPSSIFHSAPLLYSTESGYSANLAGL